MYYVSHLKIYIIVVEKFFYSKMSKYPLKCILKAMLYLLSLIKEI